MSAKNDKVAKPFKNMDKFVADIYETSPMVTYTDELNHYLSTPLEHSETNVLDYRRDKVKVWPRLSSMARDYLATTATSASSERLFSAGKHLIGITRQSILPNKMQACIRLRSWNRSLS